MALRIGLYDRLIYEAEQEELLGLVAQNRAVIETPTEARRRDDFVDELIRALPDLLDAATSGQREQQQRARIEIELIRNTLAALRGSSQSEQDTLVSPPVLLKAVHSPNSEVFYPQTGLRHPWLFTSSKADPSLLSELQAELASVDHVDILVSFITWSGVRKIIDLLSRITALDAAGNPKTKLRVLTTTYIGATEERAVTALAKLPGVEVRVSLDGRRTRLHAKAWIFRRDTGFGTAFIGSANLSEAALVAGVEWTVKFTEARNQTLFASASANFETLWNDPEFQPYDPLNEKHRDELKRALAEQRGAGAPGAPLAIHTWFDLQPKAFQQEMLDRLAAERRLGRFRNLVVAATGTGKTVVAAFDYLRLKREDGVAPRLLFVAHRAQILVQAMATFRQVLRDPAFGELLDGGAQVRSYEHLFATINTVHSRSLVEQLGSDYWRVVIVDEAHHLPAQMFSAFMSEVSPKILVGLTATPERADGQSLSKYFDMRPDGSPAVSLRLWDALEQQLLAPFEYYASADDTDFHEVQWGTGQEATQVANLIDGNVARARSVVIALEKYVSELANMKALAFCVNVKHANFMAEFLTRSGVPALSLSGVHSQEQRIKAVEMLASGSVKVICSCEVFNEGIDIPEANCVMLLRPTQSPVVFQQQIGRGLRLARGKESCLILDFVGLYSEGFRFDVLLRAVTGMSRRALQDAVNDGFSSLPPGVHIQFDRVARDRVLASLRQALALNSKRLRAEIAAWASTAQHPHSLKAFVLDTRVDLEDLYSSGQSGRSWTSLRREIGLETRPAGARESDLSRRLFSILHVDEPSLLGEWQKALRGADASERAVQMLAHQLLPSQNDLISAPMFVEMLNANPAIRHEVIELCDVLGERTVLESRRLPGAPEAWPIGLHGRYTRAEILAGVGYSNDIVRPLSDSGCVPLDDQRIELLFVTLDKREGFGESVRYIDYPASPTVFHWQSQNRATLSNATGRRYIDSPSNGWRFHLFVREDKNHPYVALGPATRVTHTGERPISIEWRLDVPLTAEIFRRFSLLRA